ncbi:MAG: S9 family peptidase [Bacteroidia bacterium]
MTLAKKHLILEIFVFLFLATGLSQAVAQPVLSVESIMRDPKWIGTSPDNIQWSTDSRMVYFDWNPEKEPSDSLYAIAVSDPKPGKVDLATRRKMPDPDGSMNADRTQMVYEKNGDIFLLTVATGEIQQITNTVDRESRPVFDLSGKHLFFQSSDNLFSWNISSGAISQLTDFRSGSAKNTDEKKDPQQQWISKQELSMMEVLRQRKSQNEAATEQREMLSPDRPEPYYYGKKNLQGLQISPDGRYVSFRLANAPSGVENTQVPAYVRESGYTEELRAYPKVGSPLTTYQSFIYDLTKDTAIALATDSLPGIYDLAAFLAEYDKPVTSKTPKETQIVSINWSPDASVAIAEVRSLDFKDRWVARVDLETGRLVNVDHQHDEAWIGGPGIPWFMGAPSRAGWFADNQTYWFMSEVTGYAHLYSVNVRTGAKKQLTAGNYEVFDPKLSLDEKYWYFTSSAVDPGERHYYKMPVAGGEAVKLTSMAGNNEVFLSPDEKYLAIRHSTGNRPWELFLQPNKPGAKARQITSSLTEEFKAYPWREPEYITFEARDGAVVHARLYQPKASVKNGAAVIFVHGAGYLQNAHKWWSSYFREYMFHNLLADKGYTVLDIDYRASAGYGRDWRTAIYRHMGGKDLSDQIDGAKLLVDKYGVDAKRMGIYGGSYGGFITLMAMFTEPDVFAAGAALRPVTDWSHYHHQYTAGILNSPQDDSIAYVRSSPIYHAEGLKGALLICHGMIDTNVHFQDAVRLSQRLIELGKENWELAAYPMESHGFVEASSWTDEYKRILKLFERELNGR